MAKASNKKNNRKEYEEEDDDDVIETKGAVPMDGGHVVGLINSPAWFDFVTKMMTVKVDIDVEALTKEFDEDQVRTRKGDFGKTLSYVPAKFIRERLNEVLDCRWSFFPLAEQRVVNPIKSYNKSTEEYYESAKYIKIIGVLAIPGLGVQVQYGVKKTYGSTEANDWKAAATDAFKKCCSAFGIEADYDIEDEEPDDNASPNIDLDDVEYDEDSLAEALEVEVTFGKYKDFTMEEILDEDPDYLTWLSENAREKEVKMAALIVLKSADDKKSSKSKGSKKGKGNAKKKESTSAKKGSSKTEKSSKSKSKKEEPEDEEDDERQELITEIQEIFEESNDYDTVTIKELIKSISVSKKTPNGKRKLEELTLKELQALANVLTDEDDDDDEEDEE